MSNAQWGVLIIAGVILIIFVSGKTVTSGAPSKILAFLQNVLSIPSTWFQISTTTNSPVLPAPGSGNSGGTVMPV